MTDQVAIIGHLLTARAGTHRRRGVGRPADVNQCQDKMTDAGAEDVEDADIDPGVYTGTKPLEEYSSGQDEDSRKEAEDEHQEE
jgi:hypothetical protein